MVEELIIPCLMSIFAGVGCWIILDIAIGTFFLAIHFDKRIKNKIAKLNIERKLILERRGLFPKSSVAYDRLNLIAEWYNFKITVFRALIEKEKN